VKILDHCRFSSVSEYNVGSCTPGLQLVLRKAIRVVPKHLDFAVTCGHRNQLDQEDAFKRGASTKHWPDSKHNTSPSQAADIRPAGLFSPADWNDLVRFGRILGFIEAVAHEESVKLRFGCDWNGNGQTIDENFKDIPHIEEAA
jgi:peptidoglycan L-alanyl-D-glutamate endopeptidase CwlK